MARVGRRRERRTEEQQREVVRQFEASGLGTREFCRREGLVLSSLQRWRARGRARAARFVELAPASAVAAPTGWSFELELPDGIRVRLRG